MEMKGRASMQWCSQELDYSLDVKVGKTGASSQVFDLCDWWTIILLGNLRWGTVWKEDDKLFLGYLEKELSLESAYINI